MWFFVIYVMVESYMMKKKKRKKQSAKEIDFSGALCWMEIQSPDFYLYFVVRISVCREFSRFP